MQEIKKESQENTWWGEGTELGAEPVIWRRNLTDSGKQKMFCREYISIMLGRNGILESPERELKDVHSACLAMLLCCLFAFIRLAVTRGEATGFIFKLGGAVIFYGFIFVISCALYIASVVMEREAAGDYEKARPGHAIQAETEGIRFVYAEGGLGEFVPWENIQLVRAFQETAVIFLSDNTLIITQADMWAEASRCFLAEGGRIPILVCDRERSVWRDRLLVLCIVFAIAEAVFMFCCAAGQRDRLAQHAPSGVESIEKQGTEMQI